MAEPEIIYEDESLLAVNKPAGLLVHGVAARGKRSASPEREQGPAETTLVDWLLKRYPEVKTVGEKPEERPGIVHRLDKGTSGVMLVAKTQTCFDYLKNLFRSHQIKKGYLVLVHGEVKPKQGIIKKPIGLKSGTTKRSVYSEKFAKEAKTNYKVIKYFTSEGKKIFSLLDVIPETGRTNQIRVHLASIHHPVVGDSLYGLRKEPRWASRLMLHAESIEFTLRSGRRLRIEAEPPKEFWSIIGGLSRHIS